MPPSRSPGSMRRISRMARASVRHVESAKITKTGKTHKHAIFVSFVSFVHQITLTARASRLQLQTLVRGWARSLCGEPGLVLALVLIGLLAHGFNMFNYPAFTFNGDEGIYTGQALAVLRDSRLSPYTYWYDHAP